jgi:cytidylate kinase
MHLAICGELGSGCTEVGRILCQKLDLKCVNSADIIKRLMLDFGESFEGFEENVRSGEVDLDKMIDSEIEEMLMEEELIVEGRSAFMLLNRKNVFLVMLIAPEKKRVEHIAKIRKITVKEAEEIVRDSDIERKNMVQRLFKKDWLDPNNYALVINTGEIGFEETADLINKQFKSIP